MNVHSLLQLVDLHTTNRLLTNLESLLAAPPHSFGAEKQAMPPVRLDRPHVSVDSCLDQRVQHAPQTST